MLTPDTLVREKPTPVLKDLDTIGKEKVSRQMKFGGLKSMSNSIADNSKIPHTKAVVLLKVK